MLSIFDTISIKKCFLCLFSLSFFFHSCYPTVDIERKVLVVTLDCYIYYHIIFHVPAV